MPNISLLLTFIDPNVHADPFFLSLSKIPQPKYEKKGTTVEQNTSALNWIKEADLDTTLQLVIGMPGETDSTIRETISFTKNIVDTYLTVIVS